MGKLHLARLGGALVMIAECSHRKVLVVDDEPLIRETLDFCLRDEYDVTAVASGEEAIELSLHEDFPVVILDLRMEGLSGIETLRRLKELHESQNVIILTAYESMETAITALNLGAYNYLTKPFHRNHLREVISRGFQDYDQHTLRTRDMQQRLMGVHDSFLSLLCHEFNTPLNVILGFSELLVDTVSDPEQKAWINNIRDSGGHLHNILMEIVDYIGASHLASTGVEKDFSLREILPMATRPLRQSELQIEIEETPALDLKLRGASNSALLISRKLVRMASHQSKEVILSARVEPLPGMDHHRLTITVRKTGIFRERIKKNDIEQLFEPYQFTPPFAGTGCRKSLGLELATCRKIAEYARGSVDCLFGTNGEVEFSSKIPVSILN